ncbi:MAG: MBL fold metallo-hydrolase [Myxococcales bacterium]|nr:MBL fold metallo-hydrolase [Myxococcales bacterium]
MDSLPQTRCRHLHVFIVLLVSLSCAHAWVVPRIDTAPDPITAVPALAIEPLAGDVWLHRSWFRLPSGPFPSNGLLVCRPGAGLLVDTAWTLADTRLLLAEAARKGCPVTALIVTHFHDDRLAGLSLLLESGARTWARADTPGLAKLPDWKPQRLPDDGVVEGVEVFFPGHAHAPDNVAVLVPEASVLFGSCMVRDAGDRTPGNLSDANLTTWPESARRLVARFSAPRIVVPGHGDPGGKELLTHTLELVSPK